MSSTLSSLKLIIFDLDGTLIDTVADLGDAVNFALAQYGFPERSYQEVMRFVGNGTLKLIERALPAGRQHDGALVEKVHQSFTSRYSEHYADKSRVYGGIHEVIRSLKGQGLKLAVLSNKPDKFTKSLIEMFFPGAFDVVLGSGENTPRKPDPTGEFGIINGFGLTPDEVLHVGDSDTDVKTAHNAGVRCIGCTWGFRPRETLEAAGADFIVDKPSEILNFFVKTVEN